MEQQILHRLQMQMAQLFCQLGADAFEAGDRDLIQLHMAPVETL